MLRHELVSLFPDRSDVEVDVREFARAAVQALQAEDQVLAAEALRLVRRPAAAPRPLRTVDRGGAADGAPAAPRPPAAAGPVGRRPGGGAGGRGRASRAGPGPRRDGRRPRRLVQLERLEQALHRELGASPGPAAVRLRTELEQSTARTAGATCLHARPSTARPSVRLFGQAGRGRQDPRGPDEAAGGRGVALVVSGPAGVGKSAVLDMADALARRQGWKVARGGASSVEGPWPYAPVLEALNALCRRHPALLDALGDDYRTEIERALSGRGPRLDRREQPPAALRRRRGAHARAAAGPGLLLLVDDVHDADEASLRLLHYLSRCAVDERILLVLAHRDPAPSLVRDVTASMVSRGGGHTLELRPLSARRRNACSWTGSPSSTRRRQRRSPRRQRVCRSP